MKGGSQPQENQFIELLEEEQSNNFIEKLETTFTKINQSDNTLEVIYLKYSG